ncbi:2TM domain-containing protein [Aquimarina brevivitae]|uniref:2TM domain-containing protein n=1 Tax=Aquimarina brevivitae TaxID=323412 RepID=A0A4Q7P0M1_9FLAO|nr:2TM domain-containing protein [Aquimarina brevivitae]RZS93341.1 2TM domain-containing protein [Aquimarina brevivitae]
MRNPNEEKRYQRAKERVDDLKKFYNNLISYVIFITFLAFVNYYTNGMSWDGYLWFLWAAFGWGIGLAFHAAKVFRINPVYDKNWEEKKIKKYMEEEEKDKNSQLWE